MKLTGRTSKKFDKWYLQNYGNVYFGKDICFEELPLAMKFSVYSDFFEENGILPDVANLEIPHTNEFAEKYCATAQTKDKYYHLDFTNDITEARTLALIKANKLLNSL